MKRREAFLLHLSAWVVITHADITDDFNKLKDKAFDDFYKIINKSIEEFESIRKRVNENFTKKFADQWDPTKLSPQENPPTLLTPPPVIVNMDTVQQTPSIPKVITKEASLLSPRPQPIGPIVTIEDENENIFFTIKLFGTDLKLRKPDMAGLRLSATNLQTIAWSWEILNSLRTNNLINEYLSLCKEKVLCGWKYLSLLQQIGIHLTEGDTKTVILITDFLFSQSGCKFRLALDQSNNLSIFYDPAGIVFITYRILVKEKDIINWTMDYRQIIDSNLYFQYPP